MVSRLTLLELSQLHRSRTFIDTLSMGAPAAESGVTHSDDFDYVISQIREIICGPNTSGVGNWYDLVPAGLKQLNEASGILQEDITDIDLFIGRDDGEVFPTYTSNIIVPSGANLEDAIGYLDTALNTVSGVASLGPAFKTSDFTLIDGSTNWNPNLNKIVAFVGVPLGSSSGTSTRIFLTDHMTQDVIQEPQAISAALSGMNPIIGHSAFNLLDNSDIFIVHNKVTSVEPISTAEGGINTIQNLTTYLENPPASNWEVSSSGVKFFNGDDTITGDDDAYLRKEIPVISIGEDFTHWFQFRWTDVAYGPASARFYPYILSSGIIDDFDGLEDNGDSFIFAEIQQASSTGVPELNFVEYDGSSFNFITSGYAAPSGEFIYCEVARIGSTLRFRAWSNESGRLSQGPTGRVVNGSGVLSVVQDYNAHWAVAGRDQSTTNPASIDGEVANHILNPSTSGIASAWLHTEGHWVWELKENVGNIIASLT